MLLDTCAVLWCLIDEAQLTPMARRVLSTFDTEVFVSSASAWEIATKTRLGKLPGAEEIANDLHVAIRELGFRELSITVEHGQRAGMLPGAHKDPFDRMLIAQAQTENLSIVSSDQIFDEYHVRRIW